MRHTTRRLLTLAALALAIGGCASGGGRPAAPPAKLYAVAGSQLLRLDPDTGAATPVAEIAGLDDLGALTYDPGLDSFYAVVDATTEPRLVAIARATGEVLEIGPLAVSGRPLTRAEALAWNLSDGRLYAAAGRKSFASNRLLEVDPTTGGASDVANVQGTTQDDVDGLVFVGSVLYAVDATVSSSTLFTLDLETGEAAATDVVFEAKVADLAYDPDSRQLFAAAEGRRELLVLSLDGGAVRTLTPAATAEGEAGAAAIAGLAFVRTARGLMVDDFESGSLSSWSPPEREGDNPDPR